MINPRVFIHCLSQKYFRAIQSGRNALLYNNLPHKGRNINFYENIKASISIGKRSCRDIAWHSII